MTAVTSTCCTLAVPGSLHKYEHWQIKFRHWQPELSLRLPVAPFKFVVEVLHRTQLVFGVERPSLRGLKVDSDAQWINLPAPAGLGRDEERLRDNLKRRADCQ